MLLVTVIYFTNSNKNMIYEVEEARFPTLQIGNRKSFCHFNHVISQVFNLKTIIEIESAAVNFTPTKLFTE